MKKVFKGYCPFLNREYRITATYVHTPNLSGNDSYTKVKNECDVPYCDVEKCPIIQSAPEELVI